MSSDRNMAKQQRYPISTAVNFNEIPSWISLPFFVFYIYVKTTLLTCCICYAFSNS